MYRKRTIKPTKPKYDDIYEQKDASRPIKEGQTDTLISVKALKNLPKSGSSIDVKVDPYTSVLPKSDPYALLNKINQVMGGSYGGDQNLDGGNTRQFLTSETSNFLNCFDSMMMTLKVNYRYLPSSTTDTIGIQYVNEMIKAIDEVISLTRATTFTSLAIEDYAVTTDINSGSYSGEADTQSSMLFKFLKYYQLILQSVAGAITNFNKFRNNMGTMMKMSWNRETPKLNSFFGLMQKKSFLSLWKSLAYTINGEYFDLDWMRQYNMINAVTSRRANAMTEPLLEIAATHALPKNFSASYKTAKVFDHADLDAVMAEVGSRMPEGYTFTTFEGSLEVLALLLSVGDTLHWARNKQSMTEQARFNAISAIVQGLTSCMNIFKPAMSDLRTMLDVVARIGITRWTKSVSLDVVKDTDVPTVRYIIVEDLFKMIAGGARDMVWNPETYRWSGRSIWNMYTGIPEYDVKSGGAFLSFSAKNLVNGGSTDAIAYLPIAFTDFSKIVAVNRKGVSVTLNTTEFSVLANPSSNRLSALKEDFRIRAPYTETTIDTETKSHLQNACLKVFGIYSNAKTVNANSGLVVETDDLAYVTYEIEDLSNEMISYARTFGPFIVNHDESRIGFLGLTKE